MSDFNPVLRIAITGASGLVGTALSARLRDDGHDVIPVVRRRPTGSEIGWSLDERRIEDGAFDGIDAVVHLAGAGIGSRRWTASYKKKILTSRTVGTTLITDAINAAKNPPSVLVSGSAIGFYGPSLTATFSEPDPVGSGFLSEVCHAWEAAAAHAESADTRVVCVRSGIVLSGAACRACVGRVRPRSQNGAVRRGHRGCGVGRMGNVGWRRR